MRKHANSFIHNSQSNLIRSVERVDKSLITKCLCSCFAITIVLTCIGIFIDGFLNNGLVSVEVMIPGEDLEIQFDKNQNELFITLENVEIIVRRLRGYMMYGNVTIPRFCASPSVEETRTCFKHQFWNSYSTTIEIVEHENELYNNFPGIPGKIFMVDNNMFKFNFPSPHVVNEMKTKANRIGWASVGVFIIVSLLILCLVSTFLNGTTCWEKFCGNYSINEKSEIYQVNRAKFKHFNKRAVFPLLPDDCQIQEVQKKHILRDFLSTILKENEEILSYEQLNLLSRLLIIFALPILFLWGIVPLYLVVFFIGKFAFIGIPVFVLSMIMLILARIILKDPLEIHYLLTNHQFIVAERFYFSVKCSGIDLGDISNIWLEDTLDGRFYLCIELVDGTIGILAHVTDPNYYLSKIEPNTRSNRTQIITPTSIELSPIQLSN